MANQIKGRIFQILKPETGISKVGNSWTKKEFVVETEEQFPKKICFSLFGEKVSMLDGFSTGELVDISFNIEAREYNSKWYNTISPWKIERVKNETAHEIPPPPEEFDIPAEPFFGQEEDGLPF